MRKGFQTLMEAKSPTVRVMSLTAAPLGDHLDLLSRRDGGEAETILFELFYPHLAEHVDKQILKRAIRKALADAEQNSMIINWSAHRLTTRVDFWEVGVDLLTRWREGTIPDYSTLWDVVRVVYDLDGFKRHVKSSDLWTHLVALKPGDVVNSANLASGFGVSQDTARAELIRANGIGLLELVYRLDIEQTNEARDANLTNWTSDLMSLAKVHRLPSGLEIDGANAANVLVGFRRCEESQETS